MLKKTEEANKCKHETLEDGGSLLRCQDCGKIWFKEGNFYKHHFKTGKLLTKKRG